MSWALIPLTEEQREIQRTAREFAAAEIAPHSAAWDRDSYFDRTVIAKMGELGFLGMMLPEEFGGLGGDLLTVCLAIEQISRVCEFYFSWQPQKRKLFEQVFRELPRFNPGRVQNFTLQVREEYLVIVEDILREGMARGEVLPINPRLAAAALHGILRMMTNEMLVGKHLTTAARAEFAVNLLFDGIGTHVQRPETS